ncbi:hypothetical protein BGW39_006000 [Mortierella sp. 14UC]|nr:hypothetical protein BGW39_006000 [Mortierella sp. 14UC]
MARGIKLLQRSANITHGFPKNSSPASSSTVPSVSADEAPNSGKADPAAVLLVVVVQEEVAVLLLVPCPSILMEQARQLSWTRMVSDSNLTRICTNTIILSITTELHT